MKSLKQPFPKGPYTVDKIGEVARILDKNGNDVLLEPGGMIRLVECANALATVWNPLNHVPATEDYVKRLVQLREEAWATAQDLQAQIDRRDS